MSHERAAPPSTCKVIGFLDVDAYECQLYQRDRPWLRGKPCVVVNKSQRIISVSPEAKRLGISRDKTPYLRDCQREFPDYLRWLHVITKPQMYGKADTWKTRNGTWELVDATKKFCKQKAGEGMVPMQIASSDELYLDLSAIATVGMIKQQQKSLTKYWTMEIDELTILEGQYRRPGKFRYMFNQSYGKVSVQHAIKDEERLVVGSLFMRSLADYLQNEIGFSTSTGVATNKFMAKLACGLNKPGKTTVLTHAGLPRVSHTVALADIPGLRGKLGLHLNDELYVTNLNQLRRVSLEDIEAVEGVGDMAGRVYSWAHGNDNDLVVHAEMKHMFRLNKPSKPDITCIGRLRDALVDLCEELECRLNEEQSRHRRIVRSIRVEFQFKYADETQQSEEFPLANYKDLANFDDFPKTVLEHIIAAGDLRPPGQENVKKFNLETLTFVIKNFVSSEISEDSRDGPAVTPKPEATPIRDLRIHTLPQDVPSARFSNHKFISSFGTTAEQQYYFSSTLNLPGLIPNNEYKLLVGANLNEGFEAAKRNFDEIDFYEKRHQHFSKWLQDFGLVEKIQSGELDQPHFISFNGRITDTMMTPAVKQYGAWVQYAMNISGIIFLWGELKPERELRPKEYFGLRFESLLHDPNGEFVPGSDFAHVYDVSTMTFGGHKLLVISEIDGTDENNNKTEVRLMNQTEGFSRTSKILKLWASNLIANVNNLVIGIRDENGIVVDIEGKTLDELEAHLESRPETCLHFQDRLLSWIKTHLQKSSREIVMRYSWVFGSNRVLAETVHVKQIHELALPRLCGSYLAKLEKELGPGIQTKEVGQCKFDESEPDGDGTEVETESDPDEEAEADGARANVDNAEE